ncbi:MAG: hypothetical protein FWH12_04460 [Treponema sp.]|nr:hypothetical protein [Treponema sp.]
MDVIQNFPFFSIFLPFSCGVACILCRERLARYISFFCLAALAGLSASVLIYTLGTGGSFIFIMGHVPSPFANEIRAGPLESLMVLLFSMLSILSLAGGHSDLKRDMDGKKINFYYLMFNLLAGAMTAVIYTNDFFTGFVFIEILTISVCALIMAKPGGPTLSAAIVYLVMSLVSSSLILFSIAMIYGVTGQLLFPQIKMAVGVLAAQGDYTMPLFVFAGLCTLGFGIKIALFPFHSWLPNAYTRATTTSSAIMAGFVTKGYVFFYIKVVYRLLGLPVMEHLGIPWILAALGSAGIVYGSFKALGQKNTKKVLGYASIVQVGCFCLIMGLNYGEAYGALIFHMLVHALGKAMLFVSSAGLAGVSGYRSDYGSLRGAGRRDPLSAAAFGVAVLSMVGIPPFPGFFSKLYITQASVEHPLGVLVIFMVVIFSTILSAMYFFPPMGSILAKREDPPAFLPPPAHYRGALILFMALTIGFSFFSTEILLIIGRGLASFG